MGGWRMNASEMASASCQRKGMRGALRWYEVRKMRGAAHERRACGIHLSSRPFPSPPCAFGEPSWILSFIKPNILQHNMKLEKKDDIDHRFFVTLNGHCNTVRRFCFQQDGGNFETLRIRGASDSPARY